MNNNFALRMLTSWSLFFKKETASLYSLSCALTSVNLGPCGSSSSDASATLTPVPAPISEESDCSSISSSSPSSDCDKFDSS